jgi:hypothetical protein
MRQIAPWVLVLATVVVLATAGCAGTALPEGSSRGPWETPIGQLELLGELSLAPGLAPEGVPVGGLSGLAYEPAVDLYYAISDDRAEHGPARFYSLAVELDNGRMRTRRAQVLDVRTLSDGPERPFAPGTVDPEGIALGQASTLYVASEGNANAGIPPFVRRFAFDGTALDALPVPDYFHPGEGRGVRQNEAFESLTLTPDGAKLFTATEGALRQDGPSPDGERGGLARILRYDLLSGRPEAEFLYPLDRIGVTPRGSEAFAVNGLVELVALDEDRLLALERAYADGVGYLINLWLVETAGATDVSGVPSISALGPAESGRLRTVKKSLILNLGRLGLSRLDNLEGMALGPGLADGRRTLVLVSDDNFQPEGRQSAQIVVLAWAAPGGG